MNTDVNDALNVFRELGYVREEDLVAIPGAKSLAKLAQERNFSGNLPLA